MQMIEWFALSGARHRFAQRREFRFGQLALEFQIKLHAQRDRMSEQPGRPRFQLAGAGHEPERLPQESFVLSEWKSVFLIPEAVIFLFPALTRRCLHLP